MSTDPKARRSLTAWLIPLATFAAGIAVAMVSIPRPAPEVPAASEPTFGAYSSPATSPAATSPSNSAVDSELLLQRDINTRFVEQLRRYETRLRDIATASEEEGAPLAAEAMRDFALETEILIDRYDLIVKNK